MALKVLLADESSTIKKAFQLALSDFGTEVKSVPSGLDVLSVALDFRPDIIFADVLLTKKSGYDVCKEVRQHPQLKNIPVILMWSSFMEFDQALAEKSQFTDKLEKPFDTEALRQKITSYVNKTQNHPLKGLLQFPEMPSFEESETYIRQKSKYEATTPTTSSAMASTTSSSASSLSTFTNPESQELEDDFQSVQLKSQVDLKSPNDIKMQSSLTAPHSASTSEYNYEAVHVETENYGDFEEVVLVKTGNPNDLESKIKSEVHHYIENSPISLNKSQKLQPQKTMSRFDEQLMREEVRLMAEKICWQLIPDLAEKLIREELQKLMKNIEKNV